MEQMKEQTILIRKATAADAAFVARVAVMALGEDFAAFLDDTDKMQRITAICHREDTLYSWANAWVAVCDDMPVGAIIGYDGARYAAMRELTFGLFADMLDETTRQMPMETESGEYYLDSLAVEPTYRNRGIARQLLLHARESFLKEKRQPVTLVVLPDNPARGLYESIGFVPEKHLFLFGEDYLRCKYLPV